MDELLSSKLDLLDAIGDGIIITDPMGIVLACNERAELFTDYGKEDVIGLNFNACWQLYDAVQVSVHPIDFEDFQQGISGEKKFAGLIVCAKKQGRYFTNISLKRWVSSTTNQECYVIAIRDASAEQLFKHQLNNYEQRLQDMFERNRAVMLLIDPQTGEVIDGNSAAINFYGYSKAELQELCIWDINGLGRESSIGRMKNAVELGIDFETTHRTKAGEVRFVHVYSSHVTWENQQYLQSIIIDITQRKIAEQKLLENEELLRLITENTSDGILGFDENNDLIYVSPSFDVQLGFQVGETMRIGAQKLSSRIHPEDRSGLKEKIYGEIKKNTNYLMYTYRILHENGSYVYREDHARFRYDGTGNYLGVFAVSRDVTERVKSRELLKENAKHAQQQANAIATLANNKAVTLGQLEQALELMCKKTHEVLFASRVGIWKFSEDQRELVCHCQFIEGVGFDHSVQVLRIEDYPNYFSALYSENIVSASNAQQDERTSEFTESYLNPNGITSLLDSGIYVGGTLYGAVCIEHVGEAREWKPDEEAFASYIGSLVAQTIENSERRKVEKILREKQRKLARTEEIAHLGSWEYNLLNGKVEWSEELYKILQYPLHKPVPKFEDHEDLFAPGEFARLCEKVEGAIVHQKPFMIELQINNPDGIARYCQSRGFPHVGLDGKVDKLYGSFQDITEFKTIEQSFRKTTEILIEAQTIANLGSYEVDLRTGVLTASENFCKLFELEPGVPHTNKDLEALIDAADYDEHMQHFYDCLNQKTNYNREYSVTLKSGRRMDVSSRSNIDYEPDGTPIKVYGIKQDITERKLAEKALRESEERYESVVSALSEGLVVQDTSDRIILYNESACKILGLRGDQLQGKTSFDPNWNAYKSDSSPFEGHEHPSMVTMKTRQPLDNVIMNVQRGDGSRGIISINSRPMFDDDQELTGVVCSFVDITERRRAEDALIQSEQRNRALLSALPDLLFRINDEHIFLDCHANDHSLLISKPEDFLGKSIHEFLDANTAAETEKYIRLSLETKSLHRYEYSVTLNGIEKMFEARMVPCGDSEVILITRDITDNKRAMEELQKMDRLRSIGTLAGGIAHDFNNIMTGLFANISLAKLDLEPSNTVYTTLVDAEKSMERATRLTQQLLTFAKGGSPIKERANLHELITEVGRFDLSGSGVKLVVNVALDIWPAEIDKGQIQQVFSNLIINAKQAMNNQGRIQIELKNAFVEQDEIPTLGSGDYIKVVIQDEGTGIPEEYLERIFDPYFSTKQSGHGLGLATVYSIISKHEGHVCVESKLGVGTTFTIYIPASKNKHDIPLGKKRTPTPTKRFSYGGRILVLDDDKSILTVCKRMLSKYNFTVETAFTGESAVEIYKEFFERKTPFDVVIFDLTIPGGMGGKEAFERIREFDPAAKCIVSSGYADDPVMSYYQEYGFKGVAVKPYTFEKLMGIIDSILCAE